jgi:hypothetical protein
MADLFGHEAAPVSAGMVEVTGELRGETRYAIAIVPGDRSEIALSNSGELWTWLPRSEVQDLRRGRSNSVIVTVPEWLAKEKGLA